MAVIDVVKYDGSDREFVWKFPSENLRLGTQLVVKTAQTAFFVRGGAVLDQFGPGTTTLHTANLPLLHKLVGKPFGGNTPFQAEVWYVNLISKLDNRWGTPAPIVMEDPRYGVIIPVRAFGQFGLQIADPRKFLESLVGVVHIYAADKLVEYFTGKIISAFTTALGNLVVQEKIPLLELPAMFNQISETCQLDIAKELANFGVGLPNFYVMSINIPENDPSVKKLREYKEKKLTIDGLGRDIYQFDRSMDVMNTAASAQQDGGILGAGLGLGMGLGAGAAVGGSLGGIARNLTTSLGPQGQAPSTPPPPLPTSVEPSFHIYSAQQQYGPYPASTVLDYIREGRVGADALFWRPGMPGWAPQSAIPELSGSGAATATPPPPPPLPMPGAPGGSSDGGRNA